MIQGYGPFGAHSQAHRRPAVQAGGHFASLCCHCASEQQSQLALGNTLWWINKVPAKLLLSQKVAPCRDPLLGKYREQAKWMSDGESLILGTRMCSDAD